jgi:hypothetical protein
VTTITTCPCGAPLNAPAEEAHGVCNRCRVEAHKKPRKRRPKPDFEDVPLPGWDEETKTWSEP